MICSVLPQPGDSHAHANERHQQEEAQRGKQQVESLPDAAGIQRQVIVDEPNQQCHPGEGEGPSGHVSRVARHLQQLTPGKSPVLLPEAAGVTAAVIQAVIVLVAAHVAGGAPNVSCCW